MANTFNTDLKSKIIELQYTYLFNRIYAQFENALSMEEMTSIVTQTIQRYYVNLGRPLLIKRYAEENHLPFIEEYVDIIDEIVADVTILYGELEKVGDGLADHFNYAQSERLRLANRIKSIASGANDLNLLANETTKNSLYIRDSFIDQSGTDPSLVMGIPAQISTREGIVTLARTETLNRSNQSIIKLLQGDGEAGTFHIVERANVQTPDSQFDSTATYLSDQTPNNDPNALLDGRPDTIFEYQSIQLDLASTMIATKGYDLQWAKDIDPNDTLRLKIIVDLGQATNINWININPYYPKNSVGKILVYSIRTSEDGFDYKPLYDNGDFTLNAELNTTPQTYRQDDIFDGSNDFSASKFSGQGVWSFATRLSRYVEFVFDQNESYSELVGHTYYEKVTTTVDPTSGQSKEITVRVPESSVSESIAHGAIGKYVLNSTQFIRKGIETFKGQRFSIGLRDMNIMSYQFSEKSELITRKFTLDKPIKEVMLYTNEKIPDVFLQDLTKANDWIQYYISFDDVNWNAISPIHRSPVNGITFPPKIYELNSTNLDAQSSLQLYKGYVMTAQPPTSVRLKMVISRPTNIFNASSFTPIVEDYALRLVFEDDIQ